MGRFRTPATSKVEIFTKEVNGEKLLIIKAKHTMVDFPFCLKFLVPNNTDC